MTLQRFKSIFCSKSAASRESMRRATFTPPYHHTSGRPFETCNPATPNSPKTALKTLEKLARGAQAKIFRASERKFCSGNTVRCLLKAVFLPHSEQESTYQTTPQAAEDRPPGPLSIMGRENARANLRRKTQKKCVSLFCRPQDVFGHHPSLCSPRVHVRQLQNPRKAA